MALVNALPKPLTLPCFIEALERPLPVHASRGVLSAQPATGTRSPRIFIYLAPLVLTVVPEGVGSELLEMGEQRPEHRSLKAELGFPIAGPIEAAEPFDHVLFSESLTSCAFCHAQETPEEQPSGAVGYVSQALRPYASERVPLSALKAEREACDPTAEAERCAMLDALFAVSEPVDWEFPSDMATFGR